VLTERYLAHLRTDGLDAGQLVAITFTDRAARQMRERIREAVVREIRAAPTDDAAERWNRHLRDLETAPINTIHGFCAALLRQYAVEAGLDPRFEVLEDVLARNLQTEALADCFRERLTATSGLGEDFRELVLLYGWPPTIWGVEALVRGADLPAWQGFLARRPQAIAADWQKLARATVLPQYVAYATTGVPKIAGCLRLLRQLPVAGSDMSERAERLLKRMPRLAEEQDLASAIANLVEWAKVGGERGKAWRSEADYELAKETLEDFRQALPAHFLPFAHERVGLAEAAAVGQRFVRVAIEALRWYGQSKRRHGVVDFHDLLVLSRDLFRD
jgi:ATP-dependent helicase/nuclease subunit A